VDPSRALAHSDRYGNKVRGYFDMRDLAGTTKGLRSIGGGLASSHHLEEHHTAFTMGYLLAVGMTVTPFSPKDLSPIVHGSNPLPPSLPPGRVCPCTFPRLR